MKAISAVAQRIIWNHNELTLTVKGLLGLDKPDKAGGRYDSEAEIYHDDGSVVRRRIENIEELSF